MASIDTLIEDINVSFGQTLDGLSTALPEELLSKFGANVALQVARSLEARRPGRKTKVIYPSEVGTPCMRKLWYAHNDPELAEKMPDHTLFKFLYGNLLEETALLLAEASGHEVTDIQKPLQIDLGVDGWTLRGRQDAVIDGVLVDVKSASPYGYKKFIQGLDDSNDNFGYRSQLSLYNGIDEPQYERQGFLVIDKQNGHIGFFEQPWQPQRNNVNAALKNILSPSKPPRSFKEVPEGKSGNQKLDVECSYCPYKKACWSDANKGAGLRGFAYSYGPVFLTKVVREPKVTELSGV